MNSSLLIAMLVFVLVLMLGLLAFWYGEKYTKNLAVRERLRSETPGRYLAAGGEGKSLFPRGLVNLMSALGDVLKTEKKDDMSRVRLKLMRAGYHGEGASKLFFGYKILLALALAGVPLILKIAVMRLLPAPQLLAYTVFCAAGGFYLPELYLYEKAQARKRKLFAAFPDALDLMVACVEAGMGLDAAIKRVGDEIAIKNRALSSEFRILSLELRAGKPRAEALRNLAARTDLEDVSSLMTLLIQTDKFGTRVAQALRVHSDSMRTKRYQRAEEAATKLPVKMAFPLIFFIFPALSITVLGPALINLYRVFQTR